MQDPRPDAPFHIVPNGGPGSTDTGLRCATAARTGARAAVVRTAPPDQPRNRARSSASGSGRPSR